ncbi:MAG: hypothetical protein ACFB5Z_17690, partial [Elainellaceae cyanobacterium]
CTELTVHFLDGHNESYTIYDPTEKGRLAGFQSRLEAMLEKSWWVLHLPDQTILLNLANVTKIEVRPGIPQIQGDAVLEDVDRMSALRKSRKMMSALTDED